MRNLQLASLCLLVMLCLLPLSASHVTLTMTATADRDVLLARPLLQQQAAGKADTPNFDIESAKVTLTFTNTGDEPLRLNTYALLTFRLRMTIIGPEDLNGQQTSVVQVYSLFNHNALLPPASEKDFPMLQSGKSWSIAVPISFPNDDIGGIHYLLQSTGVYHVRFQYANIPNKNQQKNDNPWSDDAFQGAVGSNPLTFTLLEASEPVNGLQMALAITPSADPLSNAMTTTAYLCNVSKQPIYINSWDLLHEGLQLSGYDGKLIPFTGGANRSREATADERYATLLPGEKRAFPLRGEYRTTLDNLSSQQGDFSVEDKTGFFRSWPIKGNAVHANAVLDMPAMPVQQLTNAPGPLWDGKVASPEVIMLLNPTAYRQAKLKQELTHFMLSLHYEGPQDKPYYSLHLQVQPVKQAAADQFNPIAQLSETDASTIIDYLAKSGMLRNAYTPSITGPPIHPTAYTMVINGGPYTGKGEVAYWTLSLGWGLDMYRQLQALKAALPKDGQDKMDLLLARLQGEHDRWLAEDALQRQHVVTLDTPSGPLSDAINMIYTAIKCPGLELNIDTATCGAAHIANLHFFNVTAHDAFMSLATATDVPVDFHADAKSLTVVYHALVITR